jgi:hypothetical protein
MMLEQVILRILKVLVTDVVAQTIGQGHAAHLHIFANSIKNLLKEKRKK